MKPTAPRAKARDAITGNSSSSRPSGQGGERQRKALRGHVSLHPFAGVGRRGSSIRPATRERASTSFGRGSGDERRPSNRQRSQGIHPKGFGRRSMGKPVRAMLTRKRLATACIRQRIRCPSHPQQRAISGRPSREMGSESAKAFRSPRVANFTKPFTWPSEESRE